MPRKIGPPKARSKSLSTGKLQPAKPKKGKLRARSVSYKPDARSPQSQSLQTPLPTATVRQVTAISTNADATFDALLAQLTDGANEVAGTLANFTSTVNDAFANSGLIGTDETPLAKPILDDDTVETTTFPALSDSLHALSDVYLDLTQSLTTIFPLMSELDHAKYRSQQTTLPDKYRKDQPARNSIGKLLGAYKAQGEFAQTFLQGKDKVQTFKVAAENLPPEAQILIQNAIDPLLVLAQTPIPNADIAAARASLQATIDILPVAFAAADTENSNIKVLQADINGFLLQLDSLIDSADALQEMILPEDIELAKGLLEDFRRDEVKTTDLNSKLALAATAVAITILIASILALTVASGGLVLVALIPAVVAGSSAILTGFASFDFRRTLGKDKQSLQNTSADMQRIADQLLAQAQNQ